ncbi:hypothetical protein BGX26_013031 [Mortierella sp. AD094]|nr:hypothetical protein BGX26_013031 [Mortierella sp. AD094]
MDWSPSVSVDDSEAFATTSDSNTNNNGLIDIYCSQQRREYVDPHLADRIADLCTLKLQQSSSGRHHSLLRHDPANHPLTIMLHRIRMQAFMRPVMAGYLHHHHNQFQQQQEQQQQHQQQQQSMMFEQEMSAPQPQGYDWGQEASLNSTQMSTALSFDMLLGMGSSQSPVSAASTLSGTSSSSAMDDAEQAMLGFGQPQQHHPLSSIPLVSFTGDYSAASSGSSDESFQHQGHNLSQELSHHTTSISLSSIPSSPSTPLSQQQPLAMVAALPHQTYYELLMAANPNEPLSQLLSTSATTMTSPSFSVTSSSATSTLSQGPQPSYAVLDTSIPASLTVSVPSTEGSSMGVPLLSVGSNFAMPNFPGGSGPTTHSPQQTIPLTTKEIMDALSGQFPIQPMAPSTSELPVTDVVSEPILSDILTVNKSAVPSIASVLLPTYSAASMQYSESIGTEFPLSEPSENTNTNAADPKREPTATYREGAAGTGESSINVSTAEPQQKQEESWDSDCNMQSPPAAHHHDGDDKDSSVIVDSTVENQEGNQEVNMDVDLVDLADISLLSPPSSPSKSNSRSPKRTKSSPTSRRSSRAQTRRSRAKSEAGSFAVSHDTLGSTPEDAPEDAIRTSKRRRASDDDASSSCSSPESSPPSPRTPPAILESHCTVHQRSIQNHEVPSDQMVEQQEKKAFELDSKRPKKESEGDATVSKNSDIAAVVDGESPGSQTADGARENAGVLSPSLLARYPTRHSTRILRRTSGRLQSVASCGANTHHHHVNGGEPALLTTTSKATAA